MRLLLDANLSPRIAESLRAAGFDAVHVADLGLVTATDDEISLAAQAASNASTAPAMPLVARAEARPVSLSHCR